MEIVGNRKYVEIPGEAVHELPPLLLKGPGRPAALDRMLGLAEEIVESDSLIADAIQDDPGNLLEHRRVGLAINLAEKYVNFLNHWNWGESILEWIRQCELTFETRPVLRPLLRPDVWPHASRCSFVTLLFDKNVPRESGQEAASFPPERFHFVVVGTDLGKFWPRA
jgi:hypothetical protein